MFDILHKLGIQSTSVDDVYQSLTTREGLSGWWANDTHGKCNVGDVIQFRFKLKDRTANIDMKVLDLEPAKKVLWQVVDGPKEWIGTQVSWQLSQEDSWTIVLFKHQGWQEPVEFMHHCSTKWAIFLLSLKLLHETGKGTPNPKDYKLESWE
ncbi:SRPBCC family protein [Aquirhabdus parva]|uniref:SRPBCC domain-containing protein n=1 Tax=Aquirhabdus parva TaxID=2283318 RepID=A0A345P9T3_9GAMM|nr:SRPBCC domain-containing protein [Aquirhabdus parva]AXI04042.1 SRPBCC domain-containing protein [Aquirhabdus parva]